MHTMVEDGVHSTQKSKAIKNAIILAISLALGGGLGYLYWNYIGCASGTCAITSVWWRSTLYGMLFGYLTRDIIHNIIFRITGW